MPCKSQITVAASGVGATNDKVALLSLKSVITEDPHGILAAWNSSAADICQWPGVRCSVINNSDGASPMSQRRVTSLTLGSLDLVGQISPSLSNLSYLTSLHLGYNRFHGYIPKELGMLSQLRYLNFSHNSIEGVIPMSLRNCTSLEVVDFYNNELEGQIPNELFTGLSGLKGFRVSTNKLTGAIPPQLGNLTSLESLSLSNNLLSGQIPEEITWLTHLTFLDLDSNSLSGSIPPSLYNLSRLFILGLANNHLTGTIPSGLGGVFLPNIRLLNMYTNNLEGPLPSSLANASAILQLDLSLNKLSGPIPSNIGSSMKSITKLQLGGNHLLEAGDWSFLSSLANCTQLHYLNLAGNNLHGKLPDSIGNLSSQLQEIHLQHNQISGRIPSSISLLSRLTMLNLEGNSLSGEIPDDMGMLRDLLRLHLGSNNLSGEIPPSLNNLSLLIELDISRNNIVGAIPMSLAQGMKNLHYLDLSYNNLSGPTIELSSSFVRVDFSFNSLTGPLPLNFSVTATNLNMLNLSHNKLSGEIPIDARGFQVLEELQLSHNSFQGVIPTSLTKLRGLQVLDLSNNQLTGPVPPDLSMLPLNYLNLSYNLLSGPLPESGIFNQLNLSSFEGNYGLCGGVPKLHLQKCSSHHTSKHDNNLKNILPWITLPLIVITIFMAYVYRKSLHIYWESLHEKKMRSYDTSLSPMSCGSPRSEDNLLPSKGGTSSGRSRISLLTRTKTRRVWEGPPRISYKDILKATSGFSKENLLGSGWYGSVYKGTLFTECNYIDVAVKVLHLDRKGANKSFDTECLVLRGIRHHNLVPVLTCCVGVDNDNNDFKALVYEFMPNGNLDDWLHPQFHNDVVGKKRSLSLAQRLDIAIDVACALEYLHLHCHNPIVHCDIKPNNVLLDQDMSGRVGDFGLVKFKPLTLDEYNSCANSTIGLRGSCGYIAPEYGVINNVSAVGDMYSFGILLLEMFTGKKPTDASFTNGLNLHTYAQLAFPQNIMSIVDPNLYLIDDKTKTRQCDGICDSEKICAHLGFCECIKSVFRIGLLCSKENPRERLRIEDAIRELNTIRVGYTNACTPLVTPPVYSI